MDDQKIYDSMEDEILRGGGDQAAALPKGTSASGTEILPTRRWNCSAAGVAGEFVSQGVQTMTVDIDPRMQADMVEDVKTFVARPAKKKDLEVNVSCGKTPSKSHVDGSILIYLRPRDPFALGIER